MELLVRVHHAALRIPRDVQIEVDNTRSVADVTRTLLAALQLAPHPDATGVLLARTGVILDPEQAIGRCGVVSGDDLVIDPPYRPQRVPAIPIRAVTLDVLSGVDAGTSILLLQGTFSIGRDPACQVVLRDPTVSRHHLDVTVAADWTVTVTAKESVENGVVVNGQRSEGQRGVDDDDVLALGATRIAFRSFVRDPDVRTDQLGQIEFHRTPYRPPVITDRTFSPIADVPKRPEPRRFRTISAVTPLAGGLAMFAFSGQPQFLALTLLSPVAIVGNWFDDRRSGRKKFAKDIVTFHERLAARKAELHTAVDAERRERNRAHPDLASLGRRSELRTEDLWARGRSAPDFLVVRLGVGDTASSIHAEAERGGDAMLRDEIAETHAGTDTVHGVPVVANLAEAGTVGIHGPDSMTWSLAASMVVQAASLHSPEDLVIVAAVGPDRPLSPWLKWLPHVRSVTSPLAGSHIAPDTASADELIGRLVEAAQMRSPSGADRTDRRWPWLLVLIDAGLRPNPVLLARMLEAGAAVGITVLWVADSVAQIPRQASQVIDCRPMGTLGNGSVWFADSTKEPLNFEIETIGADVADRIARSLGPVRDASAGTETTSIPRTAPLLDVLGTGMPTGAWVVERWMRSAMNYGLPFPVGVSANGVFSLDLVEDGPHALIGGTSGAGKSELLQSIVASLATCHSPERLNFLFVDYKGGASSAVFGTLPHTVGYVTNLSAELSLRALTSLRAELNRRMLLLEGRAKDIAEMLEKFPDEAPPSLVIIVDEFATLVKEIPEFVVGIVDIAQRGRSLGIHLILATQRPSGSVNENILANTNLRISLRMLDRQESTAVIGSTEAAAIPVPLKGRGYARLGPRELVSFQSAYCGAPLSASDSVAPILVSDFEATGDLVRLDVGERRQTTGHGSPTHLQAVIEAVVEANDILHIDTPRPPWRDVLADSVLLDKALLDDAMATAAATGGPSPAGGRTVTFGVVDNPERQDQYPAIVDLEDGGGLLVFGSGASGKTTLLRTIALSAALTSKHDPLAIVGFDFASRALASIAVLPQTIEIASGEDLEAVTRLIAFLGDEVTRRRTVLGAANAENLTLYERQRRQHDELLPRILLLIDNFGGMQAAISGGNLTTASEQWLDRMMQVVLDGRQVGIHTVVTADRRNAVPARLYSAIGNRLLLRHADESGYTDHGVSMARAKGLVLSPGRGIWQGDHIVQVAAVALPADGAAQSAALIDAATQMTSAPPVTLRSVPLPERLAISAVDDAPPGPFISLGRADLDGATAVVDLTWSNLMITGPPRSGRSTALETCAVRLGQRSEMYVVGGAASPLQRLGLARSAFGKAERINPLVDDLVAAATTDGAKTQLVLLIDDLDGFTDTALNGAWEKLAKLEELRLIASIETRSISGYTTNPLLTALRASRNLLLLQPADAGEIIQLTGMRASLRPGLRMPPGRGLLLCNRIPIIMQVCDPTLRD